MGSGLIEVINKDICQSIAIDESSQMQNDITALTISIHGEKSPEKGELPISDNKIDSLVELVSSRSIDRFTTGRVCYFTSSKAYNKIKCFPKNLLT